MPQQIEIPGVGLVEFPDGMDDAAITAAIEQDILAPDPAAPTPGSPAPVGQLQGQVNALRRGVATAQGIPDVLTLMGDTIRPTEATAGIRREAQVRAFSDPRYNPANTAKLNPLTGRYEDDPAAMLRQEATVGPSGKASQMLTPNRAALEAQAAVVAQNQQKIAAIPQSAAQQELSAAKTTGGKWAAWLRNPIELTSTVALESLPPSIVGGILGAPAGPAGVAMGVGASSALTTLSGELLSYGAQDYDLQTAEGVLAWTNDPLFDEQVDKALTKAAIVGGVDTATAGASAKLLVPALRDGFKKFAWALAKERAVQAGGGMGGELAGQLATGQPVDSFDVAMEGLAEVAGPGELANLIPRGRKPTTDRAQPMPVETARGTDIAPTLGQELETKLQAATPTELPLANAPDVTGSDFQPAAPPPAIEATGTAEMSAPSPVVEPRDVEGESPKIVPEATFPPSVEPATAQPAPGEQRQENPRRVGETPTGELSAVSQGAVGSQEAQTPRPPVAESGGAGKAGNGGSTSKPLTERQFERQYAQHLVVKLRRSGGDPVAQREKILREGFRKGANVNALPVTRGKEPINVVERNYQPKKGDLVLLAPKEAWVAGPNGMEIRDGWKPQPHEAIILDRDNPDMYQEYLRALGQKPTQLQKLEASGRGQSKQAERLKAKATAPADAPQRIQLKGSPQTYTVVEKLPATEIEKANGEQPIRIKNEKTGEVFVVLEGQTKVVGEKKTPSQKLTSFSDKGPTWQQIVEQSDLSPTQKKQMLRDVPSLLTPGTREEDFLSAGWKSPKGRPLNEGHRRWNKTISAIADLLYGNKGTPTPPAAEPVVSTPAEMAKAAEAEHKAKLSSVIDAGATPPQTPAQLPQGPGAATKPNQAAEKPEFTGGTSLNKAADELERAGLGLLDAPEWVKQAMMPDWLASKGVLSANPDAGRQIVTRLLDNPRQTLSGEESATLLRYKVRLMNEINDLAEKSHSDPAASVTREQKLAELTDLLDADKMSGSSWGLHGRWKQAIAAEDYSFAAQAARFSADMRAQGAEPTPDQIAYIRTMTQKIQELEAEVRRLTEAEARAKAGDGAEVAHRKAKQRAAKGTVPGLDKTRARVKEQLDEAEPSDSELGDIIQRLFAAHVAADLQADRNTIRDRVDTDLRGFGIKLDPAEIEAAISGYGVFTPLSKDAAKVRQRELRREYLLTTKLRELEAKRPLLKTGKEIASWTDEHRRLLKQVEEAKRRHGVVVTDPTRQLKSSQDARKTALRNQISDLEWQIQNRQKIVTNRTKMATDAEIDSLTAQRDGLLERFREMFPDDPEAKLLKRKADLEKSIAEKQAKLAAGDVLPAPKDVNRPADPRLEPLIQQREALNKAIAEARKAKQFSREQEIQKQLARLEQTLAQRQALLDAGAPTTPQARQQNRPLDPALEQVRQQLDEVNAKIRAARAEARKAEAATEKGYLERLQKQIDRYTQRIAEDDFIPPPKPEPPLTKATVAKLAELEQIRVEFLEKRDEFVRQAWPMGKKIWDGIKQTAAASANVMASWDLSAGRQALFAILSTMPKAITAPVQFYRIMLRPFGRMFLAFGSEDASRQLEQLRLRRGNHTSGADRTAKIEYSALDHHRFTPGEENAFSILDGWAKLPLAGPDVSPLGYAITPIKLGARGVRMSNRAFATALNEIRAAMFDELLRVNYKDRPPTKAELEVLGNYINIATGRGKLGHKASTRLAFFWSPKLLASRIQTFALQPLWTKPGTIPQTARARRLIAAEYVRAGISAFVLYTVVAALSDDDEKELTSSDFGKVILGNTRIDPWGGFQQVAVTGARTLLAETTNRRGETKSMGADRDFGQRGLFQAWADFIRSKLHPAAALAVNLASRSTSLGEPTTETPQDVVRQVAQAYTPLAPAEIPKLVEEHGYPLGLVLTALNLFGVSVNAQDPTQIQTLPRSR